MNEYLALFGGVLSGLVTQVLRGNQVSRKYLIPGVFVVCIVAVWIAAPDGASFKDVAKVGLIWIVSTVAGMFGTAWGAYQVAAQGKNQEERARIAANPMVPVTDPEKEIHK